MRMSDWSSDVCSSDLIVRTVAPGERHQTLPLVRPGGDTLLRMDGWPKVERVLQVIDAVEALGVDPADRQSVVSGKRVSVRVDLGGRRVLKQQPPLENPVTRSLDRTA